MTITLSGIIWICLFVFSFFKKDIKPIISITLISMIFQCTNIIEIHNQGIGPQLLASVIFIIRSFFIKKQFLTKQEYPYLTFTIFIFIIYILFNSLYHGILSNSIISIIQILIYLLCAIRLNKCKNLIDEQFFLNQILFIIKFLLIFSLIQYLSTKGIISRNILTPLFFNDMGENVYFHHPEKYQRLLGTFLEPSFCAPILVGSFFFIFNIQKKINNAQILLVLIFIELILTKSSTGFGTFFLLSIIYMFIWNNKKKYKYIILTFLIGIIFYHLTKDNLLHDVIFNKMESDSGKFRGQQDFYAISLFLESPSMGIGYGNSRASSLVTTLLSELGLIGILFYTITIFMIIHPLVKKSTYTPIEISSRLFIIAIIISQLIAIPDLQYCVYWLGMYIIALSKSPSIQQFKC